jgi:hypothetical protein
MVIRVELAMESGDLRDLIEAKSADDSRDISVRAVLAVLIEPSELPSIEASVARLCFEGVLRRELVGRGGADTLSVFAFG